MIPLKLQLVFRHAISCLVELNIKALAAESTDGSSRGLLGHPEGGGGGLGQYFHPCVQMLILNKEVKINSTHKKKLLYRIYR
jgi:hypothetical protein